MLSGIKTQTRSFARRRARRTRFHLPPGNRQRIASLWRQRKAMLELQRRWRLRFATLRRAGQRWSTSFWWKGHSHIRGTLRLNDPVRRMWPCIRWLLESHMGRQRRKTKRRRTPRRVRASMSWCGWFRCRHRGRCPQMWLLVVRTSERRNLDGRALLIAVWRHNRSVINYLRTQGYYHGGKAADQ